MALALALRPDVGDGRPSSGGLVLLHEGFDGNRLDATRWNTCHWWQAVGCTIATNGELEAYLPGQARVGGGVLKLVAERRRPFRGQGGRLFGYASGMISSGPPAAGGPPRFAFRYGRAQIRARMPAGGGLWSAFWLLPADRVSRPEIDVVEFLGHRPDVAELHVHYTNARGERRSRAAEYADKGLRNGWHTYAIDWRPGRLVWLIDGQERWRVTGDGVPHEPMYLVANLAVGGEWAGRPAPTTRFPNRLEIDEIKVTR